MTDKITRCDAPHPSDPDATCQRSAGHVEPHYSPLTLVWTEDAQEPLGGYTRHEKHDASHLTDEEDEWLDARYEAALDQVGGDKATHLDPMTIFMIGAKWDRKYGRDQSVRECPDPEQHAAESLPLSPDAITELVKTSETRLADAIRALYPDVAMSTYRIASAVFDALTPPARPEGAEELEADIGRDGENAPFDLTPEHVTALADHLAGLGWTKERS